MINVGSTFFVKSSHKARCCVLHKHSDNGGLKWTISMAPQWLIDVIMVFFHTRFLQPKLQWPISAKHIDKSPKNMHQAPNTDKSGEKVRKCSNKTKYTIPNPNTSSWMGVGMWLVLIRHMTWPLQGLLSTVVSLAKTDYGNILRRNYFFQIIVFL